MLGRLLILGCLAGLSACGPAPGGPVPAAAAGPGPAPADPSLKVGGVAGAMYPGPSLGPRVGGVSSVGTGIYP